MISGVGGQVIKISYCFRDSGRDEVAYVPVNDFCYALKLFMINYGPQLPAAIRLELLS